MCSAKVYYASEVTEENQPTKLRKEMGEQPLPSNTAEEETDRYVCCMVILLVACT